MYHYSKLFALFALLSLSLCNAASFYPTSLQTQKSSASNQALSVLQTKDQTGSQDTWNNYIEFDGSSVAYKGVFTFDVSSLIGSVSAYTLNVNFKGPKSTTQLWQFEWSQPAEQTWDLAGDNKAASSWKWSPLSFDGSLPFSTLVADGQVQLRLSSKKSGDNCDIDFLELVVSTDSVVTPTTTPAATPTPTSTPAATPTPTSTPAATPTPTSTPTATPKPTSTPTATPKPTSTPTATPKPTSTPAATPKPTTTPAPTDAPSTGGRICPAGQIWSPAPGTTWQWQLTGTVDQSLSVQMYDIDLFDASTALIQSLHNKGKVVICYFSTQYENWRPDASAFTASVLGSNLDDWPGERYVDIRSPIVRAIMTARMDLAVSKGCDGVEPDNVDGYTNKNGFSLTAANQLEYNKYLAQQAHARGLSIGLKNDLDQVSQLVTYFDWALNEQCNQYGECASLTPFVTAGKAVFGTEYSGSASSFCSKMITQKFSWLLKDLDLGVKVTQCCTSAAGGCTPAAYKCVAPSQRRSEYAEAFAPDAELEAIEAALAPSPFEEEVAKSE